MISDQRLEEESLPYYKPDQFYPIHIGQQLDSAYNVLGKLDYGAHSTSWLCRDTRDNSFVAIKVCTRHANQAAPIHRELEFYEHLCSLESEQPGQAFVRGLLGTFELTGPAGTHLCLVHPPMHMTIRDLQYQNSARRLTEPLLRWTLSNVLSALSFLHDEANVVHTDINPSNIMLTVADESVLEEVEKAEVANAMPRKFVDDVRTIYSSHKLGLPRDGLWGRPVLCDFGEARIGGTRHQGIIQPELYRAPEVLFNMEWNSSVDIWSVATLVKSGDVPIFTLGYYLIFRKAWDLFENKHLFNAEDENGESSATHHVAEMSGYMGLPPLEYVRRSEVTQKVFDEQGRWKGAGGATIPQQSLEDSMTTLDDERKQTFLRFIRSMLRWVPEERKRASDLLQDSWMMIEKH